MLGDNPSYPSLQTERRRSRVITWLTIDARASHKGEEERRIHPSPKVHFYLWFYCVSIVFSCHVASRGTTGHYKKRGIMPPLVGKQRHTTVITNPGLSSRTEPVLETRYPMCKGNTALHHATNYLYRLFFSKLSLPSHLTLLHQRIPNLQSPISRPSAAFPSSEPTKSTGQPELESNLSKDVLTHH